MIGLQTVLPLALKAGLSPELIIEKIAVNPRKILGLPNPHFEKGISANFILFDPAEKWTFDEQTNYSKSENSPFMNENLT